MSASFHHANLRVASAAASIEFYELIGLKVQGCMQMPGLFTVYLGDAGQGGLLELSARSDGADWDRSVGSGHVAVTVDDVRASYETLVAAGISFEGAPDLAGGREEALVCFTRDPDGNRVELVQGPFMPPPNDPIPEIARSSARRDEA
jgi:catechol 2,3-dioxygenase-like lactoylglutathione lyase family enzyme